MVLLYLLITAVFSYFHIAETTVYRLYIRCHKENPVVFVANCRTDEHDVKFFEIITDGTRPDIITGMLHSTSSIDARPFHWPEGNDWFRVEGYQFHEKTLMYSYAALRKADVLESFPELSYLSKTPGPLIYKDCWILFVCRDTLERHFSKQRLIAEGVGPGNSTWSMEVNKAVADVDKRNFAGIAEKSLISFLEDDAQNIFLWNNATETKPEESGDYWMPIQFVHILPFSKNSDHVDFFVQFPKISVRFHGLDEEGKPHTAEGYGTIDRTQNKIYINVKTEFKYKGERFFNKHTLRNVVNHLQNDLMQIQLTQVSTKSKVYKVIQKAKIEFMTVGEQYVITYMALE